CPQALTGELIGKPRQVVIGRIDIRVRQREKQIHSLEPGTVYTGGGSEFDHGVQIDGRLRIGPLSHEAWPHGIVQCREAVCDGRSHGTSSSETQALETSQALPAYITSRSLSIAAAKLMAYRFFNRKFRYSTFIGGPT